MSQPILSLQNGESGKNKATANLLPCRIQHTGAVDSIQNYWNPVEKEDGKPVAYFRGRKLYGKTVKLPEQYHGVVVEKTTSQNRSPADDEDVIEVSPIEVGAMKVSAEFDEMVVWGHEVVADATSDPFVRSIEEWTQTADRIHSYERSRK